MTTVSTMLLIAALVQAGTLQFAPPPAWKPRATTSSMRVAEFTVPRAPGDAEDGEVIVFFFGGAGGSVDANIERWVGQFRTADGGPIAAPKRVTSALGNLKVTAIDVTGTFVAEIRPGSQERFNKPNFQMRAAVVETSKGPYFIKFTGPAKTVARTITTGEFDRFMKSLSFK